MSMNHWAIAGFKSIYPMFQLLCGNNGILGSQKMFARSKELALAGWLVK
jgi:hypothetical protein